MTAHGVAGLPPLKDLLVERGLWAQKKFGQNFLFDLNITRKIAKAAGDISQGHVIEVGPGPGGLTRALFLEGAKRVIAIEKDIRFDEILNQIAIAAGNDGALTVVFDDALTVDYGALCPGPRCLVANLPYNVATPLLFRWLEAPTLFTSLVLMFQKEVADRLLATVGTSDYSRLSVMCQTRMSVRRLVDLPPHVFTPAPKVTSTVVVLKPLDSPCPDDLWRSLEIVVRHAFGMRRKMVRQSLKCLFGDDVISCLESLGIDPTVRPEQMGIPSFLALARLYGERRQSLSIV